MSRQPRVAALLLSAAILSLPAFVFRRALPRSDTGAFLVGAHALGAGMYKPQRQAEIQRALGTGSMPYLRPPFVAALLLPLRWMDCERAALVWQVLNFAAVLAALRLLRPSPWGAVAVACFAPAWMALMLGQDTGLLLLTAVSGIRLLGQGRDVPAGACLALLAAKPQLFLLLPFGLLQRRQALLSLVVVGLALFLVCCAIAVSISWPLEMFDLSREHDLRHGLKLVGLRAILPLVGVVAMFPATALWAIYAETDKVLAMSILVSPRALIYDASLALPLLIRTQPVLVFLIGAAVGWFTPFVHP